MPQLFCMADYPSLGRRHREGGGRCAQYANAVHALAWAGGLVSRLRNTPHYVPGEVRGEYRTPGLIDTMLQVAVTHNHGNRTVLDRVDDEVFSITLHSWERLSWLSGNVSEFETDNSRGSCAENQAIITKTSVINFGDMPDDPLIQQRGIERNEFGFPTSRSGSWGHIEFPFECPVEVDDLLILTTGTIGSGGRVSITLRPALKPPLVDGWGGRRVVP